MKKLIWFGQKKIILPLLTLTHRILYRFPRATTHLIRPEPIYLGQLAGAKKPK